MEKIYIKISTPRNDLIFFEHLCDGAFDSRKINED